MSYDGRTCDFKDLRPIGSSRAPQTWDMTIVMLTTLECTAGLRACCRDDVLSGVIKTFACSGKMCRYHVIHEECFLYNSRDLRYFTMETAVSVMSIILSNHSVADSDENWSFVYSACRMCIEPACVMQQHSIHCSHHP